MKEFENGLPLDGKDINTNTLSAVLVSANEYLESEREEVIGVLLNKDAAGLNYGTFL